MYQVAFKSGTGDYYDEDHCDFILADIPSNNIPNVDDILEFGDKDNKNYKQYLVREVKRTFNHENDKHKFGEWIKVYVVKYS